uniref:Uncharacterized protein n=1 Tax=Glossina austeni TaxID=7395 RepID=A0A1A9VQI4_GLOAU
MRIYVIAVNHGFLDDMHGKLVQRRVLKIKAYNIIPGVLCSEMDFSKWTILVAPPIDFYVFGTCRRKESLMLKPKACTLAMKALHPNYNPTSSHPIATRFLEC